MKSNKQNLISAIGRAVAEYLDNEEACGDTVRLAIDTLSGDVSLECDPDTDDPALDYYDLPDLLLMNAEGGWTPDTETIEDIASSYDFEN